MAKHRMGCASYCAPTVNRGAGTRRQRPPSLPQRTGIAGQERVKAGRKEAPGVVETQTRFASGVLRTAV
ncbi:hypothetical protein LZ30DRAFT_405195 [Colletotrichum cereale]|nr:hypothetical protein LZ30DRAFT_405195 [Colletotrichum cereale]